MKASCPRDCTTGEEGDQVNVWRCAPTLILHAGVIQSSIFWGYASTQIIGGFLATRFGHPLNCCVGGLRVWARRIPKQVLLSSWHLWASLGISGQGLPNPGGKRVLLFAVALWSGATCLAPLAADFSTQAFIAGRVFVGIGEGLAPAAGLRLVATWVPEAERSRAVGTLGAGRTSGAIAGLLLAPVVINSLGWQAMFYTFGLLGFVWAAIWSVSGKDREGTANVSVDEPIPWLAILQTPQLWGVIVAHFCHAWGGYALLTWTPTYLHQALGYNLEGSSEITVIPSICAVAVAAGSGIVADSLHGKGLPLTSARKIFQSIAFLVPCLMLGLLAAYTAFGSAEPDSPDSLIPVVLLTLGVASSACSYAGLFSSHADLSAKYSGLVNGISTTFAALAGVCSNAYAGYMLKATGSWSDAIFWPSMALYILGWVVYTTLYDATPVDWDRKEED